MRNYVFINEDGSVFNILNLIGPEAISENEVAAFIFEPLVLGAAGMVMYDAAELDKLLSICKKNNVFTIADEVMTGFGKTGKLFACDYLKNQPNIRLSKLLFY